MSLNILRVFEAILVGFALIASVFGAFFVMDELHAQKADVLRTEVELREEIIDRDIKKDAEALAFYRNLKMVRDLSPAEQSRFDYLEKELDRKYDEQRSIQAKRDSL